MGVRRRLTLVGLRQRATKIEQRAKQHEWLKELWSVTSPIVATIEEWVQDHDKKPQKLNFTPIDQARLLRLKVWGFRYFMNVADILDIIVPVLRTRTAPRRKKWWGLGISARSLTGGAALRILIEEIDNRYPDGEHVRMWLLAEQRKQLAAEYAEDMKHELPLAPPKPCTSIDEAVKRYIKETGVAREALHRAMTQRWRGQKAYRRNPWR